MEVIRRLLSLPRLDAAAVGEMESIFRQHTQGLDPSASDLAAARLRFVTAMHVEASVVAASNASSRSGPIHPRLALPRILQSSVRPVVATGAIVLFASTGVAHAAGLDPLHQVAKLVQAPVDLVLTSAGFGGSDEGEPGPRTEGQTGQNSGGQNAGGQDPGGQNQRGSIEGKSQDPDGSPASVPAGASTDQESGQPAEEDRGSSKEGKPSGPNGNPQGVAVGIDGNTDDAPGQTGETPPRNVPRSDSAQPGGRSGQHPPSGGPPEQGEPLPTETPGGDTEVEGEVHEPDGESGGASTDGTGTGGPAPETRPGLEGGNSGQGLNHAPETPPGLEGNPGNGADNAPETPPGISTGGDENGGDEPLTPTAEPTPDATPPTPGRRGDGNANGLDPDNPGQGHSDMPPSGNNGNGNGNGSGSGSGNAGNGHGPNP